jgi:hypothetical protein
MYISLNLKTIKLQIKNCLQFLVTTKIFTCETSPLKSQVKSIWNTLFYPPDKTSFKPLYLDKLNIIWWKRPSTFALHVFIGICTYVCIRIHKYHKYLYTCPTIPRSRFRILPLPLTPSKKIAKLAIQNVGLKTP